MVNYKSSMVHYHKPSTVVDDELDVNYKSIELKMDPSR